MKLSESTYVSISFALILGGSLFWTGTLNERIATQARDIAAQAVVAEQNRVQYVQILVGITQIQVELENLKAEARRKEESQKRKQ